MNEKISIARIYYPVKVLGPGSRVGIWTTGCLKKCKGCISPELQKYDANKELYISEIVEMINKIPDRIDGFTISGGEPFYNPVALEALINGVSGINDDIIVFTGYKLSELQAMHNVAVDNVIKMCSVIIDGEYIRELNDGIGLRGSSNQKIWIFKYPEKYQDIENIQRQYQAISYGNRVLTIGIPNPKENK